VSDLRIPPDPVGLRSASPVSQSIPAVIVNAADSIAKMPNGQTLSGQVVGRNKNGLLEVMTKLGLVQIQTPQNYAAGREISVTIQQSGSAPQVLLQLVVRNTEDRKTRAMEMAENSKSADASHAADAPTAPISAPPILSGGTSRGLLMPFPAGDANVNIEPDAILPGTILESKNGKVQVQTQFGVIEIETPEQYKPGATIEIGMFRNTAIKPVIIPDGGKKSVSSTSPSTTSIGTPNIMPTAEKIKSAPPQSLLSAPTSYAKPILDNPYRAYAAHGLSPNSPKPVMVRILPNTENVPRGANVIPGEVTFVSEDSLPTLKTPMGLVRLQTPFRANVGETVLIEILPATEEPHVADATSQSKSAQSATPQSSARNLPNLNSLMEYFHRSGTITNSMAQSFFQSSLPNINGKFVNAAMLYIAAMTAGDSKFWLGLKNSRQLDKDNAGLAEKIQSDFESIKNATDPTSESQWRHMPMPVFDGYNASIVHFYFKNGGQEDETEYGQRFVIEANLSKLGNMQFDGFIRKNHFDLVMRGDKNLPETLQQDIRRIFMDYMDLSGWNGQISFQTVAEFPINPSKDMATDSKHTVARA